MNIKISPSVAVAAGLLLSFLFFYFYGIWAVDPAKDWALEFIRPALSALGSAFGKGYARTFAYFTDFFVGAMGSALFCLPVRWLLGANLTSISVSLIAMTPVTLISLSNGVPADLEGLSVLVQPLVGAAFAHVQRRGKLTVDAPSSAPNSRFPAP